MLSIIWGSLWLIGAVLLAVFHRRIYVAIAERTWNKRHKSPLDSSYRRRTIKQQLHLTNLMLKSTSAIWAILALNSAIYVHKAFSRILNPNDGWFGPQALQSVYVIYGKYIWPIILFLVAGFSFYVFIKGLYMVSYASIWVYNTTDKALDVCVQGKFIGKVEAQLRIQNTRVLPIYKTYLIEAKDADGNKVYSKQFEIDEIDKNSGKIDIMTS